MLRCVFGRARRTDGTSFPPPVLRKFRGGKGVRRAAGVFLVLCPPAAAGALILFALVVGFWRTFLSLRSPRGRHAFASFIILWRRILRRRFR